MNVRTSAYNSKNLARLRHQRRAHHHGRRGRPVRDHEHHGQEGPARRQGEQRR